MRFTPAGPEYQVLCILLDYEACNANLITLDSQNIRVKASGFVMLEPVT